MIDPAPSPITPEGKRAADKLRSIFLLIVAANVVLAVIVMWPGLGAGPRTVTERDEMEALVERALAASNAGDKAAFLATFATSGNPPGDGMPRAIASKTPRPEETVTGPDGGTLAYDVELADGGRAKLTVTLIREKGSMKILGWRIGQP